MERTSDSRELGVRVVDPVVEPLDEEVVQSMYLGTTARDEVIVHGGTLSVQRRGRPAGSPRRTTSERLRSIPVDDQPLAGTQAQAAQVVPLACQIGRRTACFSAASRTVRMAAARPWPAKTQVTGLAGDRRFCLHTAEDGSSNPSTPTKTLGQRHILLHRSRDRASGVPDAPGKAQRALPASQPRRPDGDAPDGPRTPEIRPLLL